MAVIPSIRPGSLVLPRMPKPVIRRVVAEVLEGLADRGVLLMTAPAGYGKTSSVLAALPEEGQWGLWYGVREEDSDPVVFLAHLVGCISRICPRSRSQETFLGLSPLDSRDKRAQVLRSIQTDMSHMAETEPVTLILDDFHLASTDETASLMESLLLFLPPGVRAVLMGRTVDELRLSRLRSHGRLKEMTREDLRFSQEEALSWLASQGDESVHVISPLLDQLLALTEGWAAALSLAFQALRGREEERGEALMSALQKGGWQRDIYRYLAEEVLSDQDPDTQNLVMHTAILEDITPETASAFSGLDPSACGAILERLTEESRFTFSLGDPPVAYRYHRLFRDYLLSRLRRQWPVHLKGLLLAAGEFHLQQKQETESIPFFLGAGAGDRALPTLEAAGGHLLETGQTVTFQRWISLLPPRLVADSPRIQMHLGRAAEISGDLPRARESYRRAADRSAALGEEEKAILARARLARIQALTGHAEEALVQAMDLWNTLPDDASPGLEAEVSSVLARASFLEGKVQDSVDWLRSSLDSYRQSQDRSGMAAALNNLSSALYEPRGDFAQALEAHRRSYQLEMELGHRIGAVVSLANLGWVAARQGKLEEAAGYLTEALDTSDRIGYGYGTALACQFLSHIRLEQGDIQSAEDLCRRALAIFRQLGDRWREAGCLMSLSQIRLAEGDHQEAERLARRDLKTVRDMENPLFEAQSLANLALIAGPGRGLDLVRQAISLLPAHAPFFRTGLSLLEAGFTQPRGPESLEKARGCLEEARRRGYLPALRHLSAHIPSLLRDLWLEGMESESISLLIRLTRSCPWRWQILVSSLGPEALEEMAGQGSPRGDLTQDRPLVAACLGNMEVSWGRIRIRSQQWQSVPARDLFFYLLLRPNLRVDRETLLSRLWPSMEREKAGNNLRVTLYRLRSFLAQEGLPHQVTYCKKTRTYSLELPGGLRCDRDVFWKKKKEGDDLLARGHEEKAREALEEAISCYRGEYLPGVAGEWAAAERETLKEGYLSALESMAYLEARSGRCDQAARLCRQVLELEPYQETAHRLLMVCLYLAGKRDQALRQYDLLRQGLEEELAVSPSRETRDLLKAISSGSDLRILPGGSFQAT